MELNSFISLRSAAHIPFKLKISDKLNVNSREDFILILTTQIVSQSSPDNLTKILITSLIIDVFLSQWCGIRG